LVFGCYGSDGAAIEIDHIEGLIDVQWSRFTFLIDSVPVVEAECAIAGLLNFSDEESCTESVYSPGGDKDTIAGLRLDNVQAGFGGAIRDGIAERGLGDAWF
jgi:hypothetical protein